MATRIDVGNTQKHVTRLLRQAREDQGLTYRDLQRLTGIPFNRIYRALEDKQSLLFDDFYAIAKAMRLSPLELVADARNAPQETPPTVKPEPAHEPARVEDVYGMAAKWTPYDVRAQIEAEQDEP